MKRLIALLLIICTATLTTAAWAANDGMAGHEYDGVEFDEDGVAIQKEVPEDESGLVSEQAGGAFSDLSDINLQHTAEVLNYLKIMQGFEDGTFRPKQGVTRGEAAVIAAKMLKIDVETFGGGLCSDSFYDLKKADKEQSEAFCNLAMHGIMQGFPDGSARLDDTLSTVDAAVLIVRSLGAQQYADARGGYPVGYLQSAKTFGISADYSNEVITRGNFAKMVMSALKSTPMEMASVGQSVSYAINKNETLFSQKFDVYYSTGVVTATEISGLFGMKAGRNRIEIDNEKYNVSTSFNSFLGYKVTFYYADLSQEKTVFYMHAHQDVEIVTIAAEDFLSYNSDSNKVLHADLKSGRTIATSLTDGVKVFTNGIISAPKSLNEALGISEGSITLLSNNSGGDFELIFVNQYENVFLKSISITGDELAITSQYALRPIKYSLSSGQIVEFEESNGRTIAYRYAAEGLFDADGKPIYKTDFSKVPASSILSIYADKYSTYGEYRFPSDDATYIRAQVSDKNVVGKITEFGVDTVTIEGKEYKISNSNFLEEERKSFQIGQEGTFYLDISGKIAAFTPGDEKGEFDLQYGYLVKAVPLKGLGAGLNLKIFKPDGDFLITTTEQKLILNGNKESDFTGVISSLNASAKLILSTKTDLSQLIKYRLNADGQVSEIQTILADNTPEGHLTLSFEAVSGQWRTSGGFGDGPYQGNNTCNRKFFKPKLLFKVPLNTSDIDAYYSIPTLEDDKSYTMEAWDANVGLVPEVGVVYDLSSGSADRSLLATTSYMMVDKIIDIVDEFDERVKVLVGNTGLGEVQFKIEKLGDTQQSIDNYNAILNLQQGDIVKAYGDSTRKIVNRTETVFSLSGENFVDGAGAEANKIDSGAISRIEFSEVYYVNSRQIVRQLGEMKKETGKREIQRVFSFTSNRALLKGVVMYDATGRKPVVTIPSPSDLKPAYLYGNDESSKLFTVETFGDPYFLAIYNGVGSRESQ